MTGSIDPSREAFEDGLPPIDPRARWPHDESLHAWWVLPGRLLAGEHPELDGEDGIEERLRLLADAGIVTTIDLAGRGMPEGGYGRDWLELGQMLGRDHRRLVRPIDDRGVIGDDGFRALLADIDAELATGRPTFVHCAFGVGRTGMTVGVWLRHRGLDFDATMARIADARAGTRRANWTCPDTPAQLAAIRAAGPA